MCVCVSVVFVSRVLLVMLIFLSSLHCKLSFISPCVPSFTSHTHARGCGSMHTRSIDQLHVFASVCDDVCVCVWVRWSVRVGCPVHRSHVI